MFSVPVICTSSSAISRPIAADASPGITQFPTGPSPTYKTAASALSFAACAPILYAPIPSMTFNSPPTASLPSQSAPFALKSPSKNSEKFAASARIPSSSTSPSSAVSSVLLGIFPIAWSSAKPEIAVTAPIPTAAIAESNAAVLFRVILCFICPKSS